MERLPKYRTAGYRPLLQQKTNRGHLATKQDEEQQRKKWTHHNEEIANLTKAKIRVLEIQRPHAAKNLINIRENYLEWHRQYVLNDVTNLGGGYIFLNMSSWD
jgi:methionine synthase II (cobalamin-independent)